MSNDTPRPEHVTLTDEEREALGSHLRKRLDAEVPTERRYTDTWLQLAHAADEWFAARDQAQALREETARLIEDARDDMLRVTGTDPRHPVVRVYDDAARIARDGAR